VTKLIESTKKFSRDVVREMKLVTWPNKHDIKEGTVVVIVVSTIIGLFLAFVDIIFTELMKFVY